MPPSQDSSTQLNITNTQNQTKIQSQYIGISVTISPDPKKMDLNEKTVIVQKGIQEDGYGLVETTHPVVIDDKVGYSFVVDDADNIMSQFIYAEHDGKIYQFHIYAAPEFFTTFTNYIDDIVNSIKFF